jgi:uncharacterized protein YkwD
LTSIRLSRRHKLLPLALVSAALAALALLTGCTAEVDAEMKTYAGINAIRTQAGLPPLIPDRELVDVARARSKDMAAKAYFSHNPPDGCNFVCIMDKLGVPHAWAGENIAWNNWDWTKTAGVAVQMWHDSPPHYENIMNCHYERFGTGVAKAADGKIYYTMIFDGNADC